MLKGENKKWTISRCYVLEFDSITGQGLKHTMILSLLLEYHFLSLEIKVSKSKIWAKILAIVLNLQNITNFDTSDAKIVFFP